jgi:hypothetical protein
LDFTIENGEMLHKMLKSPPDYVITNEWKSQILEKLSGNLDKEGFDEEQIRKVARAVWAAFDL